MHDFSPGNGQGDGGLFWLVQVPDNAVTIRGNTVTLQVRNVPVIDQHGFYDPNPPSGFVPSVVSFTMSYTRSGSPRQVRPLSTDPTSAFNWAGEMWNATGSVSFSAAYTDSSFAMQGSADSTGQFGEMGYEHNGVFLHQPPNPGTTAR